MTCDIVLGMRLPLMTYMLKMEDKRQDKSKHLFLITWQGGKANMIWENQRKGAKNHRAFIVFNIRFFLRSLTLHMSLRLSLICRH